MLGLFAQLGQAPSWVALGGILIAIIIIAALAAVAFAVLQYMEIGVPPVIWRIFWIVIVAALAIVAVRFLLSL